MALSSCGDLEGMSKMEEDVLESASTHDVFLSKAEERTAAITVANLRERIILMCEMMCEITVVGVVAASSSTAAAAYWLTTTLVN